MSELLPPANLQWSLSGEPTATDFEDVYFSSAEGLAETQYVFIEHNRLIERFCQLSAHETFCIAETGFGTGLNFLATWQAWQRHAPPTAHLHFISTELYPLKREDLVRALLRWPELSSMAESLLAHYPLAAYRGFHCLRLTPQVRLTLIFDDVQKGLSDLLPQQYAGPEVLKHHASWGGMTNPDLGEIAGVDAWFLDGFAPAKNPQMWGEHLYRLMAKLSRPKATFATFTAAGMVKRGLQTAGFTVHKAKGFGKKRDMLSGHYSGHGELLPQTRARYSPSWHLCAAKAQTSDNTGAKGIAVIGAGLAGAHIARALAERGAQVTVVDERDIASGASGNPKGILYSTLSHQPGRFAEFNLACYSYALNVYRHHCLLHDCGVLDLPSEAKDTERYQQIAACFKAADPSFVRWLSPQAASQSSGVQLDSPALFFEKSGWLSPKVVCHTLLDHPNITLTLQTSIASLQKDARWGLVNQAGQVVLGADTVVLANAERIAGFEHTAHLPVKPLRGQVSSFEATPNSANLKNVLCGRGYICPADASNEADSTPHTHELGASFNLNETSLTLSDQDQLDNLALIKSLSPSFESLTITPAASGRAAFRCTVPDYLPIVGPAPKHEAMLERFKLYRANANKVIDAPGEYWPGLFVMTGFGSRGLTYAPLCAQILADQITNRLLCTSRDLALAVHPARFLIRGLIKNRI